jgi:hypothetical protein
MRERYEIYKERKGTRDEGIKNIISHESSVHLSHYFRISVT